MSKQPKALELADGIADRRDWYEFDPSAWCPHAAAELRRLHSLNAELLTALQMMVEVHGVRWEHAKADQSIPIGWVHLTNVALAVIEKAEAQQ